MTSQPIHTHTIFPIGDSAATIDFGSEISEVVNKKLVAMQAWLQKNPFEGLKDTIIGYGSLSVIYDTVLIKSKIASGTTAFDFIRQKLVDLNNLDALPETRGRLVAMPVCYDPSLGYDLENVSAVKKISIEKIIELHTSVTYRVYMIGFLPGFPYLGVTDQLLTISRKERPRQSVAAGSVGLAGNQTGIYPVVSPGGWQIIGRTPMKLFDKTNADAALLKAGDQVRFHAISKREFEYLSEAHI